MAVIRTFAQPTVESRPMPATGLPNRSAPVEAFGNAAQTAGQARDLQVAGQFVDKAADSLERVALTEMRDMNETRVQDLSNQFVAAQQKILFTAPDAFYRQKGDAAIKAAESTTQALLDLKKNFADQTGNSYQRQALEKRLDLHIGDATGGISRHVATQAAVWQDAVAKGTVANAQNEAALNYNDPAKVAVHAEGAYQTEYDRVFKETGSPEAAKASATAAQSKTYRDVISLQVSGGDSAGAIATFEAYKDKFSAGDRTAVVEAIKTMQISDTAANNVKGMVISLSPPPDPKDAPGVVKHFEGLIFKAKVDTDGQYRVGYGSDTVTHPDGTFSKVKADTVVTKEDAERDLARRLPQFQAGIKERIGSAAWDALSPEAKASATSIAYNYGSIPDRLVKSLQSGDPAQIAEAIRGLSGDNGRINARRRGHEAAGVSGAKGQGQLTHDGLPARQNPDGSYSTEVTITVTDPKLNGGKPTNIPSLWGGKEVSEAEAIELAVKSGKTYVGFDSVPQAVEAAKAKSAAGGAAAPQNGPDYKDTRVLKRQVMDMYDAMTLDNQRRNPTSEKMRSAEQQRIELWKAGQERQIEKVKLDLELGVDEWMTKGGNVDANGRPVQNASGKWVPATERPPPAIWNQLHYEKQKSIDATLVHNAGGKDVQITQEVMANYQTYRDMAYNDPQRFLEQDLSMLVGKLPKAHIDHLMNQREALLKDGTKPLEDSKLNSAIDVAFKGKIDTSPTASEKDKALKSMFLDDLKAWSDQFREDNKGLRPNAGQIQKYIDEKMIEHWAKGDGAPGWLERQFGAPRQSDRNVSGNKVRSVGSTPGAKYGFTLTEEERKTAVPIYAEIPKLAAQQIEKELQLNPINKMSEAQRSAAGNYGAYAQAYKKPVEKKDVERVYGEFRRIPARELEAIKKFLTDSNEDLSFTNIITMYREAEAREKAQAK